MPVELTWPTPSDTWAVSSHTVTSPPGPLGVNGSPDITAPAAHCRRSACRTHETVHSVPCSRDFVPDTFNRPDTVSELVSGTHSRVGRWSIQLSFDRVAIDQLCAEPTSTFCFDVSIASGMAPASITDHCKVPRTVIPPLLAP